MTEVTGKQLACHLGSGALVEGWSCCSELLHFSLLMLPPML